MALDLSSITNLGATLSGLLGKAQGEAPVILDAVKNLVAEGAKLFETVKSNIGDLSKNFGGTMTPAETAAAIDAGFARLKADMDAVDADPKTGQATV